MIRDDADTVPEIPNAWKKFEKILKTNRIQVFSAYYLTEMAGFLQTIRNDPTNQSNFVCYCDYKYYS